MLLVDKEILTDKQLKSDVRFLMTGSFVLSLIFAVGFTIALFGVIQFGNRVLVVVFIAAVILFGTVLTVILKHGIELLVYLGRQPIVVVATRAVSGSKKLSLWSRMMSGRRVSYRSLIYFHGYGVCESLRYYESSWPGDKFYLLLDKHGNILKCYPCNDYIYEGELTPNPRER